MTTQEIAQQLKKGRTFTTGYRDALVLDTFRHYAFCEVTGINTKFYDICTATYSDIEGIRLHESANMVGFTAGNGDGSGMVPLSKERVSEKWTAFIIGIGQNEARQREADAQQAKREQAEVLKREQAMLAKEFKIKCEEKLRTLAASMEFKKFISSKDVRGLFLEAALSEFYNTKKL